MAESQERNSPDRGTSADASDAARTERAAEILRKSGYIDLSPRKVHSDGAVEFDATRFGTKEVVTYVPGDTPEAIGAIEIGERHEGEVRVDAPEVERGDVEEEDQSDRPANELTIGERRAITKKELIDKYGRGIPVPNTRAIGWHDPESDSMWVVLADASKAQVRVGGIYNAGTYKNPQKMKWLGLNGGGWQSVDVTSTPEVSTGSKPSEELTLDQIAEQRKELERRRAELLGQGSDSGKKADAPKKRARKKVTFGRKKGDENLGSDVPYARDALDQIQANLKEELLSNSDVSEDIKQRLLSAIDAIKTEEDYLPVYKEVYALPPKKEKKGGKDDSKFKGTEGKWKELLDSAPSQRARNKLNAILQRWDDKNGDADKETAYANWLRSELEGTLSWQDKERAYVRKNIPANESDRDSRGLGGPDLGEKKGRKVSMERMPDGRMKFITTEADGTVMERIEGDEMKFGEGLEETPPEAWEEYGRRYGDQTREEDEAASLAEEAARREVEWESRPLLTRIKDWLLGNERPKPRYAPEVLELLARSRTPEERKLIQMVARATEKHNGIRMQDAADRGVKGAFARIRDSLKGGGKAVAIATAITVAVAMSGGTLAAMPLLAKVIGAGTGALASTWAKNRVEKVGRAGKISKYVVPWMIGTIAGVATGAAAGNAIEAMSSYFSNAVPDAPTPPPQGAGQAGANAIAPSGRSGVLASSLIPSAPPGFDLGDYGYLGKKLIVGAGDSIWAQVTDGLCDQGLLDGKGRAAFADAFYRTVEDGGFKDLFLSYNNRPLGSGVFWNNLPVGTVGHYDRLLSDPRFVDMLVDRIGDNYPSLLKKINSGGFSAFDFIRGVAYSHGAKI